MHFSSCFNDIAPDSTTQLTTAVSYFRICFENEYNKYLWFTFSKVLPETISEMLNVNSNQINYPKWK